MIDLEQSLAQLKKIEPDMHWVNEAKQGVMHRIGPMADEFLVETHFKKAAVADPRMSFLHHAKGRVMNQVAQQKPSWVDRLLGLRRFVTSAFIVTFAVFGALVMFPSGTDTTAVAADSPLLEVLVPEVTIQEDNLAWKGVIDWLELEEGDLLRTNGEAVDATFHFGDVQVRPGPDTVLLLTRLKTGDIQLDVSQGSLWVSVPAERAQEGFISIEAGDVNVLIPEGSTYIQANTLGKEVSVQTYSGLARVTYADTLSAETKVDVLTGGQALNIHGKKEGEGVVAFDVELAQQNPTVQRNLQRDKEQRDYLKGLKVNRLKNVLLSE